MHRRGIAFTVSLNASRLWLYSVLLVSALLLPALSVTCPLALLLLPWFIWRALAQDGWLAANAKISKIQLDADGKMMVLQSRLRQRPEWLPAKVFDNSVALPWLIVLNLQVAGQHHSVAIFADSAPAEARRQLRVFLRWPTIPAIV